MTELDFDELDKAVNSLMGTVKEKDPSTGSKTLDVDTTLAPDETPTYGKLGQIAEKIDGETTDKVGEQTVSLGDEEPVEVKPESEPEPVKATPAPVPVPVATPIPQKSGRFMDVVHPSSDMRSKTDAAKPVSRVAATVAAPGVKVAPIEDEIPLEDDEDTLVQDVAGDLPSSSEPPVVLDKDDEEVTSAEPLSSPFLPDAKVEKRPLGAVSEEADQPAEVDETPEESSSETADEGNSKMDVQSGKSSEDVTEHIPEEFKDELLAIEQSSATDEEQPAKDPLPIGAASIPKQYQEKQSTGDKSTGAIYDTDNYHKPLAGPTKKKPVVLWIVITILIIILGAAAGAAVYFFGVL